ncbi:MAG: hypothetical protein F4X11_12130 [Acidobacteria bacterium]|nr:hypothetical protein [Acidobacteriota bacterium]
MADGDEQSLGDATEARGPEFVDAYRGDATFYRIIAYSLGIAISLSIVCSLVAVLCGKSVPNGITAIGSAAVGALAGIFTATSRG